MDAFFQDEGSEKHSKALSGKCTYTFDSAVNKSFNRGHTDSFVNLRHLTIASWDSPKSKGQHMGKTDKNHRK